MEVKDVGGGKFILNHKLGWYGASEVMLVDGEYSTNVEFQSLNGSFSVSIIPTEWKYPKILIQAHEDALLKLAGDIISAIRFGRSTTMIASASIVVEKYDEKLEPDCEVLNENP